MMGGEKPGTLLVGRLLAAWGAIFAASFLIPFLIPPEGEGFTRGLNRVVWWFWFQVGAGLIGIAAAVIAGRDRQISSRVRWATHVVLALTLVLAMLLALLVMGAAD